MIREHFAFRETITTILADEQAHIDAAKSAMIKARRELEDYIKADPFFQMTYEPLVVAPSAPRVVQRMADGARDAGVGPMAAVAASIAWAGVEAMKAAGARFALIDNGGDIVFIADRDVRVGIYAGSAPSSGKFAFVIPPQEKILAVCTSSATVGPSVSFGTADAVVCISRDPAIADAWATSLCNVITQENFPDVVSRAIGNRGKGYDGDGDDNGYDEDNTGVCGVYAVCRDWVGSAGSLPKIVSAAVDTGLITKG